MTKVIVGLYVAMCIFEYDEYEYLTTLMYEVLCDAQQFL